MPLPRLSRCWASAVAAAAAEASLGPTFGRGYLPAEGSLCRGENGALDTVVLNHTLSPDSTHGVMHYFWATGPQYTIDRVWVSYYVDGEAEPSIRFQPSMMCGVAFPTLLEGGHLFNAGSLCGKNAKVGGFHNSFPIPFQSSVVVTVAPDHADGRCTWGYFNLRGTENLPLALPGLPLRLPTAARLRLHRNDMATRQPLEWVKLMEVPKGREGIVAMTAFAVEARPVGGVLVGGVYIEGCWQLYGRADEPPPGVVVGTGVEDYFGSSYYFGADAGQKTAMRFTSDQAGLTIFDRNTADGVERVSAYRLHLSDPLTFVDGGRLQWQVGAKEQKGLDKCGAPRPGGRLEAPESGRPTPELSPVNVTTYAWVYSWAVSSAAAGVPGVVHI